MNDKTIVSNAAQEGLQSTVATSYALDRVLQDAMKYGGLQGVPLDLAKKIKRGLGGDFISPEPVLKVLLNELIGHPELWVRSGRTLEANAIVNRALFYVPSKKVPLLEQLLPYLFGAVGAATLILSIIAIRG